MLAYTATVAGAVIEHEDLEELHRQYSRTGDPELCRQLVEAHQHLAAALGRRMSRRFSERDDVTQVAMIGLLKAINRFDPSRGVGFTTFAWRTIEGEVKRHFRDSSWSVHVPRSLQERSMAVSQVVESLTQELGASPSVSQVADRLALTDDEVIEVFELQRAVRSVSLEASEDDEEGISVQVGVDDTGYDRADDRGLLGQLLRILPPRERSIVRLRFVDQLSQSEIAARVGLSQMHVSRLLTTSLARLREYEQARQMRT